MVRTRQTTGKKILQGERKKSSQTPDDPMTDKKQRVTCPRLKVGNQEKKSVGPTRDGYASYFQPKQNNNRAHLGKKKVDKHMPIVRLTQKEKSP